MNCYGNYSKVPIEFVVCRSTKTFLIFYIVKLIILNDPMITLLGNPYCRGRLSIFDILVINSLDQLIFTLEILFEPSPSLSVP
jgi:hypothetical protein